MHASTSTVAFAEGSMVEVLLFGFKQNTSAFMTSFNASQSSENLSGNAHVCTALRHLIKTMPLLNHHISNIGPDGRRLYSEENTKAAGGIGKLT